MPWGRLLTPSGLDGVRRDFSVGDRRWIGRRDRGSWPGRFGGRRRSRCRLSLRRNLRGCFGGDGCRVAPYLIRFLLGRGVAFFLCRGGILRKATGCKPVLLKIPYNRALCGVLVFSEVSIGG